MRVPAGEVEGLVLDRLRQLLASRRDIADALASCGLTARELDLALRRAVELSQRWLTLPPKETRALARQVISRINLSPDGIEVAIGAAQLACALGAIPRTEDAAEAPIRLAIAAELRRALHRGEYGTAQSSRFLHGEHSAIGRDLMSDRSSRDEHHHKRIPTCRQGPDMWAGVVSFSDSVAKI